MVANEHWSNDIVNTQSFSRDSVYLTLEVNWCLRFFALSDAEFRAQSPWYRGLRNGFLSKSCPSSKIVRIEFIALFLAAQLA